MTATVHVLCGPAGAGKTRRLAERFREAARAGVGAALWLGPTHRHVEALREGFAAAPPAWLGLHLFTFQDFADEVVRVNDPAARPLPEAQRRVLIEAIVAELHAGREVVHFGAVAETRGFGEGMVVLLAELKRSGVRPADLARAAYRRGCAEDRAGHTIGSRSISRKDRECVRVYARCERLLRRHRLLDLEGRVWYAHDLLRRGARQPFEQVRAVFVDGFTDFTAAQHAILECLAEWVEELWIALPDEESNERAELFTRPRAALARLQALRPRVAWVKGVGEHRPGGAGAKRKSDSPLLPFPEETDERPAGLAHVERQLFRPLRRVLQSPDAAGIRCIEAPGLLGEARMVTRLVKTLLLDGTPAEDVLVTARDLEPYADLLREVFAEYGIPADVEGTEPLARAPVVATLLRALRLPDDDWPFAAVTALLRSGYFRPDWPEVRADADVVEHAEVLLRLLGEPRNREAYCTAVRRWVEEPPPGLEDEQAEESRRRRTHDLAKRCRPFLERFFAAWDQMPLTAPLADHVAWLRRFADDLGLPRTAVETPRDAVAWLRLEKELDGWLRLDRLTGGRALSRREFQRRLATLAAGAGLARTPRGPGRVRVLSAPLARTLEAAHLFVLGLGERAFPKLAAPGALFDEAERQAFKQAGLNFPCLSDVLPDEMLLFYQLVTRARRQLVLSYPAVDDRGQSLLPSSFLSLLLECFTPEAVPVERRRMLIEGHDTNEPLSPAEYRVQAVREGCLPGDLGANLRAAAGVARLRLHEREFSPYDGRFRDPAVIAEVGALFGPEKVFSPTALEDYIACPFRFFLRHVLRLEELEEPREEIEVTRRGQAFHRALARLHGQLRDEGLHRPGPEVDPRLLARLHEAVEEYAARAAGPAAQMLWRLEGQRLARAGARYAGHWQKFLEPWQPAGSIARSSDGCRRS